MVCFLGNGAKKKMMDHGRSERSSLLICYRSHWCHGGVRLCLIHGLNLWREGNNDNNSNDDFYDRGEEGGHDEDTQSDEENLTYLYV